MNDLNLRVAAIKLCSHPKRFAEMREALAPMPTNWLNSEDDHVRQFAAIETCSQQVQTVRELFGKAESLPFLADLLFACPLKHPVRNALTKQFSSGKSVEGEIVHSKEDLLAALRLSIHDLVTNINHKDVSVNMLNDVIVSISACLQNFPNGRNALAEEIQFILPLLPMALLRYGIYIKLSISVITPTRRNEFYLYIQNVMRLYINILAHFKTQLDFNDHEHLLVVDNISLGVARHVDIPWDVRSIVGVAMGQTARFFNKFNEYLVTCRDMQDLKDLPIKAGLLLVLQKSDYTTHSEQILDLLKDVIDVVKKGSNITNLLVYISKHLYTYSKSLTDLELKDRPLIMYNLILVALQRFSMEYIQSNVDSIRHMCANVLRQVLMLAKHVGQMKIIDNLFKQLNRNPMPVNTLALILEQPVAVMGTTNVLRHCPYLFAKLFPDHLGAEDGVNSLFKCMLIAAHAEQSYEEWSQLWIMILARSAAPYDIRLEGIERLVKAAVTIEPRVCEIIVMNPKIPFSTKLAALITARRSKKYKLNSISSDQIQDIQAAILGVSDNTRMQALSFIVETPRLSEPYTQGELDAITCYLQHNTNNPSAHVRQIGYGLLQKAIKRLELNLAQLMKNKKTLDKSHMLIKFLNRTLCTMALYLFPTANYGRRWLSLRLMRNIIDMMERLQLSWDKKLPPQTHQYLESTLRDSYEHNKIQAVYILRKVQICCNLKPTTIMKSLISSRPPVSITGAYQLQVYCQAAEVSVPVNQEAVNNIELPEFEKRFYIILQMCLASLVEGIQVAKNDLTAASKSNPLYGLLFAIRHLLQQLKLDDLAKHSVWRDYVNELLNKCSEVSEIMLPVVGSSSPEGHMPENAEKSGESFENVDGGVTPVSSQLVLLCAWRSVKEVSNIMGELAQLAPFEGEDSENYLVSEVQLMEMGEHFVMLLSEIKHRGAFEQAYVGFTLLCRRLWVSKQPVLHILPTTWLEDAINLISGDGGQQVCSTRRSAGLPYMLQALICTELKLGTHCTLNRCMSCLFDVCKSREAEPTSTISRGHALNIMRALYRCRELSELMSDFIARGVICAFNSLDAEEWSERNSATLLLSALVVRIFGVERARDIDGNLNVRNRMTGRIFFTRYPQLFDYFHEKLKIAAESTSRGAQTIQLEAMLQLLCRLYPSALEGTESSLNLTLFVPFLIQICYAQDNMTRQNSTQVLANFVDTDTAVKRLRTVCVLLKMLNATIDEPNRQPLNFNAIHGYLLQVMHLYGVVKWQHPDLICSLMHTLAITGSKMYGKKLYIYNVILKVLITMIADARDVGYFKDYLLKALTDLSNPHYESVYACYKSAGISPKLYILFMLHLCRANNTLDRMWIHMIRSLIKPEVLATELLKFKLDLWFYALLRQGNNSLDTRGLVDNYELQYFDFDPDLIIFYKSMHPKQSDAFGKRLRKSPEFYTHIKSLLATVTEPRYISHLLGCSALMNRLDYPMEQMLEMSGAGTDMEPGLVLCVTQDIKENGIGYEQRLWLPLLKYVAILALPSQTTFLRFRAVQLFDYISSSKSQILRTNNVEVISLYTRLGLQLLVDESELVRNYMAEMVSSSMGYAVVDEEPMGRISTVRLLPTVAERYFMQNVLENLAKSKPDGSFLIGLFNEIVEPFVSPELLEGRCPAVETDGNTWDLDDIPDVFDKQESNPYCESLRLVTGVSKTFKTTFAYNTELLSALSSIETLLYAHNTKNESPDSKSTE